YRPPPPRPARVGVREERIAAVALLSSAGYNTRMTEADLKDRLNLVQNWPEAAQDELVALANQIESELQGSDYVATREELQVIDAAMASIDAGETASEREVEAT